MPDKYDEKAAEVVAVARHRDRAFVAVFGMVVEEASSPECADDTARITRDALATLLRTVAEEARREEREACAAECDGEAAACESHLRATKAAGHYSKHEKAMGVRTHESGAAQSRACAHRIRARGEAQGREGES